MANIVGGVTSINNPRTNWAQTDAKKADYLKNKPPVANALKGNKAGAIISADDVSPVEHELDVKVRSKNIIPFPYAYQHREIGGLTVTHNADGSLVFNGTSTGGVGFVFKSEDDKTPIKFQEDVILSLTTEGTSPGTTIQARIVKQSGGVTYSESLIPKGSVVDRIYIQISKGTCENFVVKPQLEYGTVATEWVSPTISIEGTKVTRRGKNFFDMSKIATTNNITNYGVVNNNDGTITVYVRTGDNSTYDGARSTLRNYAPYLEVGETYVLNAKTTSTTRAIYSPASGTWAFGTAKTITEAMLDSPISWYAHDGNGNDHDRISIISEIQIEKGSKPTECESYFEKVEATADAMGRIHGITSAHPTMEIITDNENAVIECAYNRDASKVITDIETKLNTLIATIGG